MVWPKAVLVPPASGCTGCRCYQWWQMSWSQARRRCASDCFLWCRRSAGLLLGPHSTTAQDKKEKQTVNHTPKKLRHRLAHVYGDSTRLQLQFIPMVFSGWAQGSQVSFHSNLNTHHIFMELLASCTRASWMRNKQSNIIKAKVGRPQSKDNFSSSPRFLHFAIPHCTSLSKCVSEMLAIMSCPTFLSELTQQCECVS